MSELIAFSPESPGAEKTQQTVQIALLMAWNLLSFRLEFRSQYPFVAVSFLAGN